MAARRAQKPVPVTQVQTPTVEDAQTQRALDTIASAVQQLQANRTQATASVTGSRSSGDALASLLRVLAEQGIIVDDTTA